MVTKKAKKVKKSSKKFVNKEKVLKLVDEIARKLVSLKHGYIVNDELEELRKMVR